MITTLHYTKVCYTNNRIIIIEFAADKIIYNLALVKNLIFIVK